MDLKRRYWREYWQGKKGEASDNGDWRRCLWTDELVTAAPRIARRKEKGERL